MAIKIIKGIYGYKDAKGSIIPKTSKDEPFSLTDEQEARLVRKGVAVYVEEPQEEPQQTSTQPEQPMAPEPSVEPQNQDKSKATAEEQNETKNEGVAPVQQGEKIIKGHLDKEQLSEMGYNDLKHLAKELGVPAIGSKEELIEKIAVAEVEVPAEDNEEEPPTLQPADPE